MATIGFGCSMFKDVTEKHKETVFILIAILLFSVGLAVFSIDAFQIILSAIDRAYDIVELEPPEFKVLVWNFDEARGELEFKVGINEVGNKELSHIMDFGILIIMKNPDGVSSISVKPYKSDELTKEDYEIRIDFEKLIGEKATIIPSPASWAGADHLYYIDYPPNVKGGGYLVRVNKREAFVNGSIRFFDWEPEKYYIIIWAVDEYGNAKWICLHVASEPWVGDPASVTTTNEAQAVDPERDGVNYFYVLNDVFYVPYTRIDYGEFVRGFVIILPYSCNFSFGEVTVCSPGTRWGVFILRFEELFKYGRARAGGVVIYFFVDRTYILDGFLMDVVFFACLVCVVAMLGIYRRR